MIEFHRLESQHLRIFRSWLAQDHIKPFWQEPESESEFEEKFLVRLPQRGVQSFVIQESGQAIGYIQYYEALKVGGGWWENEKPGTFGIDLMIGEKTHLGRGLGPKIIREFIELLIRRERGATSIIIDPEPSNLRAIKAFGRAGFIVEKEMTTPGGRALLMRMNIPQSKIP